MARAIAALMIAIRQHEVNHLNALLLLRKAAVGILTVTEVDEAYHAYNARSDSFKEDFDRFFEAWIGK